LHAGLRRLPLPVPAALPASSELFSPSETTDLFGFLENFNYEFDFDLGFPPHHFDNAPPRDPHGLSFVPPPPLPPPPGPPHIDPALTERQPPFPQPDIQAPRPSASSEHSHSSASPSSARPKSLLSTPQKRLNHILSEQKRRNAIRDGYMQLTTLLAPAGAPPGSGMPTRGRPKGSGSRGRGSKGKSGILFKAKEYIHFLEEGRDALLTEVLKVEAAAGIRRS
ncbi:uncharacterized protein B0H18DRAFT_970331, partial [Fomitopsis serialis]|uniref:uncharacterized protein n=1 Tax=Fomitopsis serialis TaxID=139415 RepID=UPI00200872D2